LRTISAFGFSLEDNEGEILKKRNPLPETLNYFFLIFSQEEEDGFILPPTE